MKKSRFTDSQILDALKRVEAGFMGFPLLEGGREVIEKQKTSGLASELSLDRHVVEMNYVLDYRSVNLTSWTFHSKNLQSFSMLRVTAWLRV